MSSRLSELRERVQPGNYPRWNWWHNYLFEVFKQRMEMTKIVNITFQESFKE